MNFSESQTSKKENYNSYQKSVWRKTLTQSAFCFQNCYLELYKKKSLAFTWRHPLLKTSLTGSFWHEQLFWVKVQVPASKHSSKHLCGPTTLLQRDCSTVVFSWILRNFSDVLQNILWTVLSLCLFLYSSLKISLKLNSASDTFLEDCLLLRKLFE